MSKTVQRTRCETPCDEEDGISLRPNGIIWSICEKDVLELASEKGIHLTEQQLDDVAKYVERGLSAVCNWFMVVEMALDEVVR